MPTSKEIKLIINAILEDKQFQARTKQMASQGDKASKGLVKSFSKAKAAILGIGASIVTAVFTFNKIIKTAREFEFAIAKVAAVSGDTRQELERLAREAGERTIFTATEAAGALEVMARAGLNAKQSANLLVPALNLAAGAAVDITTATELTVAQIKTFGLEMNKASNVTDLLFGVTKRTATNVEELGFALKFAGPAARTAGISLQDTTAILGQLAQNGIKGSLAGTAFRQTILKLVRPVGEATEVLDKYGLTQERISELLPTPIKLFEELRKANLDNTEAATVFGARGLSLFNIIKNGLPELIGLRDSLEDVAGEAKEAADVQLNTLEGQIKLLISASEELALKLGDRLIPFVTALVQKFRDLILEDKLLVDTVGKLNEKLDERATISDKLINRTGKLSASSINLLRTQRDLIKTQLPTFLKQISEEFSTATDEINTNKIAVALLNDQEKELLKQAKDTNLSLKERQQILEDAQATNQAANSTRQETIALEQEQAKTVETLIDKLAQGKLNVADFANIQGELRDRILETIGFNRDYAAGIEITGEKFIDSGNRIIAFNRELQRAVNSYLAAQRANDELVNGLTALEKTADGAGKSIENTGNSTRISKKELEDLNKKLGEVKSIFDTLGNSGVSAIVSIISGFKALKAASTGALGPLGAIITLILKIANLISDTFQKIGKAATTDFGKQLGRIGSVMKTLIKDGFTGLAGLLKEGRDTAKKISDDLTNLLIDSEKKIIEQQIRLIQRSGDARAAALSAQQKKDRDAFIARQEFTKLEEQRKKEEFEKLSAEEQKREIARIEFEKNLAAFEARQAEQRRRIQAETEAAIAAAEKRKRKLELQSTLLGIKADFNKALASAETIVGAVTRNRAKRRIVATFQQILENTKRLTQMSFAIGTESVPADMIAKVHKNERIIPARMNIPAISNEDFVKAALRGLNVVSPQAQSISQTTTTNMGNTLDMRGSKFTIPANNPDQLLEALERLEDNTNSRIFSRG